MIRRTMLSRRRLLAAAALTAGSLSWTGSGRTAFGATQTLPASAVEVADGAFFPIYGGGSGFYVRNVAGGSQFWSFYDGAGGHAWYGPPISGVWEDSNNWYQLFANALFVQSKRGGPPGLGPLVDLIVNGPVIAGGYSNATQLEFDGWPAHGRGAQVDGAIQAFVNANAALQTGPARSNLRNVFGTVRNLFANLGLETPRGGVRLGVLGQLYRRYFEGTRSRLPAAAVAPETLDLGIPGSVAFDDLPGDVSGIDRGFGCTLASEEGPDAGIAHMDALGLWWDREQFIWNAMQHGYSEAALPTIATDRNFRVSREVIGLLQFAPAYAGGGAEHPAKYNPPSGLELPASDPANHYGRFVHGVVSSRRPLPEDPSRSASGLNPISRWIAANEPDICRPSMPGYAWGGEAHQRWIARTDGQGEALPGEIDESQRRQLLYRLVQVAHDSMSAADPAARLIFPSLGWVDAACDNTPRRMQFWDGWVEFLAGQLDREALIASNFFFHDVSLTLHKEPERVYEVVGYYREALDTLSDTVGAPDPLAGNRRLMVIETGLQDDPGLCAFFDNEDKAHFIIQSLANAFAAGADEIALHKLVDYPLYADSGRGARTAVRYLAHVAHQHPQRRKLPDVGGERAAHAYAGPVRIDLPGPGFVTSVFYNRGREPVELSLSFEPSEGEPAGAIHLSDHVGNERRLEAGSHVLRLEAPRKTFNAYGKNWAWVGGGTHLLRYSDSLTLTTDPQIPERVQYGNVPAQAGAPTAGTCQ